MDARRKPPDHGFMIGRCWWLAAVTGWKITSTDTGVSDPAHVELTLVPMVNNAMARVHAAITKVFATAVQLRIVISPPQKRIDVRI
jgi:hypothetical protein